LKKHIILLLALALSLPVFSSENLWELIIDGSYDEAVSLSLSLKDSEDIYNLHLSTLYNILGDLDRAAVYDFEFFKNPHNTVQKAVNGAEEISSRYDQGNVLAFFGVQLWELGQKERALEYLEDALEKTPDNPFANNYYSMKFYFTGAGNEYLRYARKAIQLKDDYSEAYNNAAVACMMLDDYAMAAETLVECLAHSENPHRNTYYNLMSSLKESEGISIKNRHGSYTLEGSLSFTGEGCEGLYSIVRDYPKKCEFLLIELLNQGNYSAFQTIFARAVEDNIEIDTVYLNFMSSYYYNDIEGACGFGEEYLGQENPDINYLYDIGNFFSRYSPGNAPRFYLKAIGMLPDYDSLGGMRYYSNLGTSYLRSEEYETGIGYLEKALDFNAWDTITLVNLGMAYAEIGDRERARDYLDRARDSTGDSEYLSQINELLGQI